MRIDHRARAETTRQERPRPALLAAALAVMSLVAIAALHPRASRAEGLRLDDAGITFPDKTVQTTASSAGSPDALFYSCRTTDYGVFDLLSPNETRSLMCIGWFGPTSSSFFVEVPVGRFFFVTDVLVGNPDGTIETGKTNVRLRALDSGCAAGTGAAFDNMVFYFRTTQDLETKVFAGSSPLFVLPQGTCLSAFAYSTNSTEVDLRVNGYLTNDPTYFHPARR